MPGRAKAAANSCFRIEDLDPTRCRPEFVDGIFEDLRWLGLDWDEPVWSSRSGPRLTQARSTSCKARGLVYRLLLHPRRHRRSR